MQTHQLFHEVNVSQFIYQIFSLFDSPQYMHGTRCAMRLPRIVLCVSRYVHEM